MIKPASEKTKTHDSRFRANRARESRPRAVPRTGIVVRERKCRVAFDSTARFELGDLGPTIDLDSYTLPRRYAATSILLLLLLHLLSTRLSSFRFFLSFDTLVRTTAIRPSFRTNATTVPSYLRVVGRSPYAQTDPRNVHTRNLVIYANYLISSSHDRSFYSRGYHLGEDGKRERKKLVPRNVKIFQYFCVILTRKKRIIDNDNDWLGQKDLDFQWDTFLKIPAIFNSPLQRINFFISKITYLGSIRFVA